MEDNIPGFSLSSNLRTGPHRVAFVPQVDQKPSSRVRSITSRRRWNSFSEVIFDNERFLARRPPRQIHTTPTVAPPPSKPHKARRKRPRGKKDWSMNTIFSQENVDEDISTYLANNPTTTTTQPPPVENPEHSAREDTQDKSNYDEKNDNARGVKNALHHLRQVFSHST